MNNLRKHIHLPSAPEKPDATVSVVIPTRNRPLYLMEAVYSALRQTHPPLEIVIVDDGSNDHSRIANQKISAMAPIIRYFRLPTRQGVADARNVGLANARGDFMLFLDDDDLLSPRMIAEGIAYFEKHPHLDVVVCGARAFIQQASTGGVVLRNDQYIDSRRPPGWPAEDSPAAIFGALLRLSIPINSCLIRRAKIGAVRFARELTLGEDTFFWLCLAHAGGRFGYYPRVNAYVRRHTTNSTASRSEYRLLIQRYYQTLLACGMLQSRRDIALTALQTCYFQARREPLRVHRNLPTLLRYADIYVMGGARFIRDRLRKNRSSIWRYF